MDIILSQYPGIQTGTFEIRRTVTVAISATDARRQVHRWLLLEVSHMMGADEPTLVVGDRTCWRVPVHLSAPQVGLVGQAGEMDVDAVTGQVLNTAASKTAIEQRARDLMINLPPFRPQSNVPAAYLPGFDQRAPQLLLNDEGESILTSSTFN